MPGHAISSQTLMCHSATRKKSRKLPFWIIVDQRLFQEVGGQMETVPFVSDIPHRWVRQSTERMQAGVRRIQHQGYWKFTGKSVAEREPPAQRMNRPDVWNDPKTSEQLRR